MSGSQLKKLLSFSMVVMFFSQLFPINSYAENPYSDVQVIDNEIIEEGYTSDYTEESQSEELIDEEEIFISDDDNDEYDVPIFTTPGPDNVIKLSSGHLTGKCGDNLDYDIRVIFSPKNDEYDQPIIDDIYITITGSGEMYDYDKPQDYTNQSPFTRVVWDASAYTRAPDEGVHLSMSGVTRIGDYSFYVVDFTELSFGNDLREIGENAFASGRLFDDLVIPEGVTKIGKGAFDHFNFGAGDVIPYASLSLPSTLEVIPVYAFSNSRFGNVYLSEGLKTIEKYAFDRATLKSELRLPSTVESIGAAAFSGCSVYGTLIMPENLAYIGGSSFNFSNIEKVVFNTKITKLESDVFSHSKITSVTIPDTITELGDAVFWGCEELKSVVMPKKLDAIGESCFLDCEKLSKVVFPENLKTIPSNAFSGCNLTGTLEIPDSVVTIESTAFSGNDLTKVIMGENVKEIGEMAFLEYDYFSQSFIGPKKIIFKGNEPEKVKEPGEEEFTRGSFLTDAVIYYDSNKKWTIDAEGKWHGYRTEEGIVFDDPREVVFHLAPNVSLDDIQKEITDNKGYLSEFPKPKTPAGKYFGGWYTGLVFGEKVTTDTQLTYVYNYENEFDLNSFLGTDVPLHLYARFFDEYELRYYDDMANTPKNRIDYLFYGDLKETFYDHLKTSTRDHIVDPTYRYNFKGKSDGICYGASCVIAAYKKTNLDVLDYCDAACFNDLNFTDNKTRNLLTTYHLEQYTNAAFNEQARMGKLSDKDKLRDVVEKASAVGTNGPAVLVIHTDAGKGGEHAIVIDGLETGGVEVGGETYYYTVKTYDINEKEGLNKQGIADFYSNAHNYPVRVDPSISYLYITKDFSRWTMKNASLYKNPSAPLKPKYIKMCFNDDRLINSYLYDEPDLDNGAELIRLINRDLHIGYSGVSVSVDDKTADVSDLVNYEAEIPGVFTVGSISGEENDAVSVFLPKDRDKVSLNSDEGLSLMLRDKADSVMVETDAKSSIISGSSFTDMTIAGSDSSSYEGSFTINAVCNSLDLDALNIQGQARSVVNVKRTDDVYYLSPDGKLSATMTIGEDEKALSYEYEGEGLVKIDMNPEEGEDIVSADEDHDGVYETTIQPVLGEANEVLAEDVPKDGIIPDGIWVAGVKDIIFNGKKQTQEFRVYDGTVMLTPKTDYTVSYKNNQKAYTIENPDNLTATDLKKAPQIVLSMKGNYSGKETVYFSIKPSEESGEQPDDPKPEIYPITGEKITITDQNGNAELSAQYNKSGARPVLRIKYENSLLKEGRDYTLKYSGNTKYPANKASVTITGKGRFKGKKVVPITVKQRPFSVDAGITVVAYDKAVAKKPGKFYTTIKVFDLQGKLLKAGTDYEKNIVYLKDGVELTKSDHPQIGDRISVRVTGKGGYTGSYIETSYSILDPSKVYDIGKSTIKIKPQPYNKGKAVVISSEDMIDTAVIGKNKEKLVLSTDDGATGDYMVVPGSYVSNTNKGKAKVTFMGINGKTGTKTVTFSIGARSVLDIWLGWIRK